MATTLKHGDYIATVEYDPDLDSFFGRVANIRDVVTFYGRSVDELRREFAASIEIYLDFCRERGVEPSKPFSGVLNLRLGPERHGRAAAAAALTGKSLNAWLIEAVDDKAREALGG